MSEEKFHKEDEQVDDLFRSSLGEMRTEPSAEVWSKLNRQLFWSEMLRFNLTNLPKAFWGIIPAAAIIIGIAIYLGTGDNQSTPVQPVEKESITLVQEETQQNDVTTTPTNLITAPLHQGTTAITPTNEPLNHGTTAVTHTSTPLNYGTNTVEMYDVNEVHSTPLPSDEYMALVKGIPFEIQPMRPLFSEPMLTGYIDTGLIILSLPAIPQKRSGENTPIPTRQPFSHSLDIGLNITPDMVFYNTSSGSFKYNYTFDLGARYNIGRFYIQSGAGLTYSSDIGDYAISYLKNDSVGFYYTINSFTIEPGNPEEPYFETKQVTVYDSVEYLYDYSTKNKYYYIQVPLNVGYRIINKPTWRLSVEAGLIYAYLVSVNEPAPAFFVPEGRILDIERRTPQRNNHSLGLTGGISVEYQFAKNFFLLIEPAFKYYLQAIEENSSRGDKQPYSVGLRAGIWYRMNFNNKTR